MGICLCILLLKAGGINTTHGKTKRCKRKALFDCNDWHDVYRDGQSTA